MYHYWGNTPLKKGKFTKTINAIYKKVTQNIYQLEVFKLNLLTSNLALVCFSYNFLLHQLLSKAKSYFTFKWLINSKAQVGDLEVIEINLQVYGLNLVKKSMIRQQDQLIRLIQNNHSPPLTAHLRLIEKRIATPFENHYKQERQ